MTTTQTPSKARRGLTIAITLAGLLILLPVAAAASGLLDVELDERKTGEDLRDEREDPRDQKDEESREERYPEVPQPREIPGAWPDGSYYEPPQRGELFVPGDYHSICVPSPDGRGNDHFIVDADSLRVFEMVVGSPKLSEFGFVAATCELPWDVPWPQQPRDSGGGPPRGPGDDKVADDEERPQRPGSCSQEPGLDHEDPSCDTEGEDPGTDGDPHDSDSADEAGEGEQETDSG